MDQNIDKLLNGYIVTLSHCHIVTLLNEAKAKNRAATGG